MYIYIYYLQICTHACFFYIHMMLANHSIAPGFKASTCQVDEWSLEAAAPLWQEVFEYASTPTALPRQNFLVIWTLWTQYSREITSECLAIELFLWCSAKSWWDNESQHMSPSLLMVSSLSNKLCSPKPCLVVMKNTLSCSSCCESFSSWMHRRFLAHNDFSFNMPSMYKFESDGAISSVEANMHPIYIYMHDIYIYIIYKLSCIYITKKYLRKILRSWWWLWSSCSTPKGYRGNRSLFMGIYPNFIFIFQEFLWSQWFPWIGVWLHRSICGMWDFDSMFVLRWLHHCQLGYRILETFYGQADVKTS